MSLIAGTKQFKELCTMLDHGHNIQLLDVNGPTRFVDINNVAVYPYTQMRDGVYGEDGVGSILMTNKIYDALIVDPKSSFSHVYPLAYCLINAPRVPISNGDVSNNKS